VLDEISTLCDMIKNVHLSDLHSYCAYGSLHLKRGQKFIQFKSKSPVDLRALHILHAVGEHGHSIVPVFEGVLSLRLS
jgi:hypothetical protein